MRKNIQIALTILVIMSLAQAPSMAQTIEDLINDYKEALVSGDKTTIQLAIEAIKGNESALIYVKANLPELYEEIDQMTGEETAPKKVRKYPINKQVKDFPISDRRDNAQIAADESNRGRSDNRTAAMKFPNQNRPSNNEIIRQRLKQIKSVSYALEEGAVILSISGVSKRERRALARILENDFKNISSIEEIRFRSGIVEYKLELDSNVEEFSERLEKHEFGSFHLDLIHFTPERLDYILKPL